MLRTYVDGFGAARCRLITWAAVLWLLAGVASGATNACTGDCDGKGTVTVDELVMGVNIALGNAPLETCSAFDRSGEGAVTVDELVAGVNSALHGCEPPTRVMRGLAVIVDFADVRLEDYSGDPSAITRVDQVRRVLDDMEAHWAWMSLGRIRMEWDLTRVQLDQRLAADSFQSWTDFRTAVAERVIQQIEVPRYDSNADGVIDAMFGIVSSQERGYPYLIGGTSRHGGANQFHDGQMSLSLRSRAIGNFNHETGHCLGLRDEYGLYSNIGFLSLMSSTWPLPPFGFSGWGRYKLGWFHPRRIEKSTAGVVLRAAEEDFDAVIIPSARASEYFFVEYRKKPASGYGTATPVPYDGLAIYHVWEARGTSELPPLIRLESAEGVFRYGADPAAADFWYPGNPTMASSFAGKPYYFAEQQTLVEIDNLAWVDGDGMRFDVVVHSLPPPTRHDADPIVNGDFESGNGGAPEQWSPFAWMWDRASFGWDPGCGVGGSGCIRIENTAANDAGYEHEISGLTVGERYRVRAMVRVDSIDMTGAEVGANLSVIDTWQHSNPVNQVGDWTPVSLDFVASSETIRLGCRIGYWGSTVAGVARFDNVGIEWVFE